MSYAVPLGRHRADSAAVRLPSFLAFKAEESGPSVDVTPKVTPSIRRQLLGQLPSLVVNVVMFVALVGFLMLAIGPHVLGYRTATMLTGSMAPMIMPGDVVVTMPKPAADVQVGDVITYQIPIEDHRVETHRITEVIEGRNGEIAIRTKGDSNAGVDPWTATLEGDTVWEVTAVVPKVGHVIRALRVPAFQQGVMWVSLGSLLLLGLVMIWGRNEDDDENDEEDDDDVASTRDSELVTTW